MGVTGAAGTRNRPRVLVSAYACGPGDEPEANAGWAFAVAAATHHDVHVVTRERFRPAVERALAADPDLSRHLTVEHLELGPRLVALKRGALGVYWYYVVWQRAFARRATAMHARTPFDVVHHVTFANDWLPCGAATLEGPALVWGPVGGASALPVLRLARWLGVRGTLVEAVRVVATGVPRAVWGDRAARRAAVVVAQNADVAQRFRRAAHVLVEPNAAFAPLSTPDGAEPRGRRVAVLAARLLAWKGGRLAVTAMADPALDGWRLDVYGTGYEERALRRLAQRLGVADRVHLRGHRPRAEVLRAFASADALLFPSMHDQAGWVAAEASSLGTPVVCLPLGGPPLLAADNARVVPLDGDVPAALAAAVRGTLDRPGHPHDRWRADRLVRLVDAWYARAVRSAGDRGEHPAAGQVAPHVPGVGDDLAHEHGDG
ncbi:glycosyltransferase [Cellulomonas shaoxiangyii]|uniref:Glycosyltransferase n=1 Tax=Cellulomonas shaoxiangyii TaxID=2566013 RepID=A0A4P7SNE2_9CELL|nr:glycosyltransferase [Cellulomonas shaoxiangyii]QCB94434.1 glycosyltransferase [Cellulomonas shaoxiangyii]TGY85161.1 glycosyltransferase [Cellulomonas shaoxiangyii]